MIIIPFGPWTPDQADFGNPGALICTNVIPAQGSYLPFLGPTVISDALDARCQGAIAVLRSSDSSAALYAVDATKLYSLTVAAWTDASKAGGYSVASLDIPEFAKFGDTVICALGFADNVQAITIGDANFADLFTSVLKPKARVVGTTEDFAIFGDLDEGGVKFPYRVRWTALDDITDIDASAATLSDFQDLSEGDQITKIVGFGRDAVVFQRRSMNLMRFEGGKTVFRFDEVERNRGAIANGSVIAYGRHIFYLADDGFYMWDWNTSTPIGREKVDRFFFGDVDSSFLTRISAAIDPVHSLVAWAYPSAASGTGVPDKVLLYNWAIGQWAVIETITEILFLDVSKGFTLDQLDSVSATLEDLPFSLDSRNWAGGGLMLFAGFNNSHQTTNFNGTALDAVLETTEAQHAPGETALVDGIRPLVDTPTGTITVQVAGRDTHQEQESFGAATSLNSIGEADIRESARYHRYRVNITGGFDHAQGVDVDAAPHGRQ